MCKDFIVSERAVAENMNPINMSHIVTFEKSNSEVYKAKSNKIGKYFINFFRSDETAKAEVLTWRYKSEECRDADFKALIEKYTEKLNINQ